MNPLSKKVRIISLVAMLVLFVIIGPLILAYSVGYRIDDLSDSFSWVKTGGVYINSDLTNTEVYRDGKFVKSGGYILKNIFIQNLRSEKEYVFEVRKDGYHSWRKVIPVKESYVAEAHAMMFPLVIEKTPILPFIDEFGNATTTESELTTVNELYLEQEILFGIATGSEAVSDGILSAFSETISNISTRNVLIENSGNVEEQSLDENDIENGTTTKVIVPEYFIELGIEDPSELNNLITNNNEAAWVEDGGVVVHWIGKEDKTPYYYCTFTECRKSLKVRWDTEIMRFSFMPGRNDVIFVLNEDGIWATELDDRSTRNIQPIYLGEDLDFRINSNNRVVVLDDGIFYELRF